MARQAREAAVADVLASRPVRHRVEGDLDERGEVFPRVAEHRYLGDVRARTQDVLDIGGRERLAACSDDEVARPVDEAQPAVLPFADIAGAKPTVRAAHLKRRLRLTDILLEYVIAAKLDLAGVGDAQLPTRGQRADVSRTRERLALAADDRADLFGLAVRLAQVHAPDLPQRCRLRRQRRAGADHQA